MAPSCPYRESIMDNLSSKLLIKGHGHSSIFFRSRLACRPWRKSVQMNSNLFSITKTERGSEKNCLCICHLLCSNGHIHNPSFILNVTPTESSLHRVYRVVSFVHHLCRSPRSPSIWSARIDSGIWWGRDDRTSVETNTNLCAGWSFSTTCSSSHTSSMDSSCSSSPYSLLDLSASVTRPDRKSWFVALRQEHRYINDGWWYSALDPIDQSKHVIHLRTSSSSTMEHRSSDQAFIISVSKDRFRQGSCSIYQSWHEHFD